MCQGGGLLLVLQGLEAYQKGSTVQDGSDVFGSVISFCQNERDMDHTCGDWLLVPASDLPFSTLLDSSRV